MVNLLMDIFFPQTCCSICREPGRFSTRRPWCPTCQETMVNMQNYLPVCIKCGKYLERGGKRCMDCQQNPPEFDIARSVGPYEQSYRIAIKVLKFMRRRHLAVKMGDMMATVVIEEPAFMPVDVIVPVPISAGNLKLRGFNQTELLGRQISKTIKVKMEPNLLYRIKETPSQRELTRAAREKNLLHAFKVRDASKVAGKHILLVDDVYTTGSTSKECARTLRDSGAEKVAVITWAIGKGF
ncbi:MAG: ComF family protein [Syntrophomonadaceae bacterium]|nr:ComF family protein [Syntrophomonadaceae bacterium]MDD3890393.1 ComF family protein [Syntrophomonadaceae bacterium]